MRDSNSDRVDLRSDTVTQPTNSMRQAMADAVVGDDVLGDDPTVKQLESMVAEMCGKESGLFVPSGTMSNAVALKTHTDPGDEIITERYSHIYLYEGGGYAALCGSSIALPEGTNGLLTPDLVQNAIRKQKGSQSHYPDGSLVCVENTANRGGGTCYEQEVLDAIAEVSKAKNCSTHIDGARIFNASVATNTPLRRMTRDYDSVSICLSKGLGAPVGSVLVGSEEFIGQAHRWRKMFGGACANLGFSQLQGCMLSKTIFNDCRMITVVHNPLQEQSMRWIMSRLMLTQCKPTWFIFPQMVSQRRKYLKRWQKQVSTCLTSRQPIVG